MSIKRLSVAVSLLVLVGTTHVVHGQDDSAKIDAIESKTPDIKQRLGDLVPKLREEKKLVGLAAMVMTDGKVVASAVDGERKFGSGVALQITDLWHLGSITKSMTATMIARMVEQEKLEWTTTIEECLGESIDIHEDYRDVTFEELLTHTAGCPANFSFTTQFQRPPEGPERVEARRKAVAAVLAREPKSEPGSSFQYSNVGITIAAAMVEAKTGKSWEALVREEVFQPLEIKHAGYGPPRDGETELSQPRGHSNVGLIKHPVGQGKDNSPIMAPAGYVHMTLEELCRYGNEHRLGEHGQGTLLKKETYARLHQPKLNHYAYGWIVFDKDRSPVGKLIWHNGSNTMWYALLAILPEKNTVIAVTSNDGNIKAAEAAAFEIVKQVAQPESRDD